MKYTTFLQAALLPVAIVAPVHAGAVAQQLLTIPQAQAALLPRGAKCVPVAIELSSDQLKQIKDLSGMRQREKKPQVWKAVQGGSTIGWFIVDNVIGKHEFITYGTALSREGKVLGTEILEYRETHGSEVEQASWRKNFVGKSLSNPPFLNQNVPNISGATLSSRNITDGIRRLLALQKVALVP